MEKPLPVYRQVSEDRQYMLFSLVFLVVMGFIFYLVTQVYPWLWEDLWEGLLE